MFDDAEIRPLANKPHESGEESLGDEERRKNKFFGFFHPNMERLEENHGYDRNKEGTWRMEMNSGYDRSREDLREMDMRGGYR